MPIVLDTTMPATRALREEGVEVITPGTGRQKGRPQSQPLRIAILNLMPEKPVTEAQIARVLGETAYDIEPTFFVPGDYRSKSTPDSHIAAFYERWPSLRSRSFDGLIVTGAPVETLPFEEVTYWRELTEIMEWARVRVGQTYYICWAAQAALWHFHGVPKRPLPEKMFGVFPHRIVAPDSALMTGLAPGFGVPVSRHTEVAAADLPKDSGLEVLASSGESGLCLVGDAPKRAVYMFNHLEYDAETLAREYRRDLEAGRPVPLPKHYFPDDDPARAPAQTWRGSARILYRNWLDLVRRHAEARHEGAESVEWLLGRGARPALAGTVLTDFRIDAEDPLVAVPGLLRVLAAFGHSPSALRTEAAGAAGCTITLRVAALGGAAAERVARHMLHAVRGARRAAYRDPAGVAGVLLADRMPTACPKGLITGRRNAA